MNFWMFFRYKEQQDIALAKWFLDLHKEWVMRICAGKRCHIAPSGQSQRQRRGFEPLLRMMEACQIPVYSSLIKQEDFKQSSLSKADRPKAALQIQKKQWYPPVPCDVLIDDVLTTGATVKQCVRLLEPESVFAVSAHPLWLEQNRKNNIKTIVRRGWFW